MLVQEITLPIVSFRLAKLAKQKGFDSFKCREYYDNNGKLCYRTCITVNRSFYAEYNPFNDEAVLAPTVALLQLWLFKAHKHGINSFDIDVLQTALVGALLTLPDVKVDGDLFHLP